MKDVEIIYIFYSHILTFTADQSNLCDCHKYLVFDF